MRQGMSVSVSLAIGMAIFVLAIASTFLILQGSILPSGGFSEQISSSANYALDRFYEETSWTIYRQPIIIHADTALTDEPLELTTPFSPSAVPGSIAYVKNGKEIVSQHSAGKNESVFLTDLRKGTTLIHLVYTTDYDLPDRTYESSLEQAGNSTWNEDLNVTFSDTGFEQFAFKDLDYLTSTASIGASSNPVFTTELLRTNVTYNEADRKEVRVFDQSGQVRIRDEFTGEAVWTFNLTDNFTTMYTADGGTTVDLGSSGTLYTGTTDFIDFYDVTGFAIIGENMFVNVSRDTSSSPIDVRINVTDDNGEKEVLLYGHDGNYTNAVPQKQNFYNPYNVSMGVPVSMEGISKQQASGLEASDYDTVQETLGLVGSEYNITIPGVFEKGRPVNLGTTVHVFEFPTPIVERFTNTTVKDLQMRVWNR